MKKFRTNSIQGFALTFILFIIFLSACNEKKNEIYDLGQDSTGETIKLENFKLKQVQFFNKNGEPYEFKSPSCLQVIGDHYYIIDSDSGVFEFNKNRELTRQIYKYGQGPKEIGMYTQYMTTSGTDLIIVDTLNTRAHIYDTIKREYAIIKKPFLAFTMNAVAFDKKLWFGALTSVFEINRDQQVTKHDLFEEKSPGSFLFIGTIWDGEIVFVLKGIYREKFFAIFKRSINGDFKLTTIELPQNEDLQRFDQRNTFKSVMTHQGSLYINTNQVNTENGAIILKIDKDDNLELFHIKNTRGIVFSQGAEAKYILSSYDALIYQVIN